MVFSSLFFLYAFLPLCLLCYLFVSAQKTKNTILLVFSLVFYAWGEPVWIILMIMTAALIHYLGLRIDSSRGSINSRIYLALTVSIALGSLAVFKYSGFLVENLNLLPFINLPVPAFSLPIGISFYTFQSLTYAIDLYRGNVKVQRSFKDFLLYVSLFPQLIAGPIVRYSDIAEQIQSRSHSLEGFAVGISRFLIGLGKKVLIANHAGEIVSQTIGSRLSELSTAEAWMGLLAFSLQIYFDFSGYSDMAIGLGQMFGFSFKENFNYPYASKSITDFWRRWHISLGSFFRDYLYIPLGGNKKWHIRNMFIVWALTGLWHGASWNFVIWGLYFFILLIIEKYLLLKLLARLPAFISHLYAMFTVAMGWVFFYFDSVGEITMMLGKLYARNNTPLYSLRAELLIQDELIFLIIAILLSVPLLKHIWSRIKDRRMIRTYHPVYTISIIIVNLLLLFFSTAALVGSSFNPFLYFRF